MNAAVVAWLAAATGIIASKIFLARSKFPQPAYPYITFNLGMPRQVGGRDEERWTDVGGSPPAGAEELVQTAGQREFTTSIQFFTLAPAAGPDYLGNLTAKQYLSQALAALARPSIHDALAAAG